ncbi:hypothetical protein [Pedobacter gandavensis]|uniref:hypothetical protein n=1 Tax=Pedobacter gandavensis TaxID=2679963 RepID=UPI00292D22BA|nr:hypothetical protein [Pedobacter gandavensis]
MYKDETSRFITENNAGPLFSGENSEDDLESGTIYILRSLSDHPLFKENQEIVHKIGVTGGDVKERIANAKFDPTFLMIAFAAKTNYKKGASFGESLRSMATSVLFYLMPMLFTKLLEDVIWRTV